jgi:hypothetical protein
MELKMHKKADPVSRIRPVRDNSAVRRGSAANAAREHRVDDRPRSYRSYSQGRRAAGPEGHVATFTDYRAVVCPFPR